MPHMYKQNFLSLILLIPLVVLMNPKKGIYRHFILYPLRLLMPILAKKKKLNNKKKPNNIKGVKKEELAK